MRNHTFTDGFGSFLAQLKNGSFLGNYADMNFNLTSFSGNC